MIIKLCFQFSLIPFFFVQNKATLVNIQCWVHSFELFAMTLVWLKTWLYINNITWLFPYWIPYNLRRYYPESLSLRYDTDQDVIQKESCKIMFIIYLSEIHYLCSQHEQHHFKGYDKLWWNQYQSRFKIKVDSSFSIVYVNYLSFGPPWWYNGKYACNESGSVWSLTGSNKRHKNWYLLLPH